jgi:hypothetical protein
MKISKKILEKIIREEVKKLLDEQGDQDNPEGSDELEDCSKHPENSKEREECEDRNADRKDPP